MNALGIMGGMALASLVAFDAMAAGNVDIIAEGSSLHSAPSRRGALTGPKPL